MANNLLLVGCHFSSCGGDYGALGGGSGESAGNSACTQYIFQRCMTRSLGSLFQLEIPILFPVPHWVTSLSWAKDKSCVLQQ